MISVEARLRESIEDHMGTGAGVAEAAIRAVLKRKEDDQVERDTVPNLLKIAANRAARTLYFRHVEPKIMRRSARQRLS